MELLLPLSSSLFSLFFADKGGKVRFCRVKEDWETNKKTFKKRERERERERERSVGGKQETRL